MIRWAIILSIIAFAIVVLLNVFFTYVPISRIEKTIDKAASAVEETAKKVDSTDETVNKIIDKIEGYEKNVVKFLDKFCAQLDEITNPICIAYKIITG